MSESMETERRQCFTSIQSRKLLGSLDSFHLCPSMDLVVYNTSAAAHQQHLYRTVSWQKVAVVTPEETTTALPSMTCWSPSGRWMAVSDNQNETTTQVSLYGVEPLANPPGGSAFGSSTTEVQHSFKISYPVQGLTWAHVGRPHPTAWTNSIDEHEDEVSWSYQSTYVDKARFFLPPSEYLHPDDDEHHRHHEQTTTTALPECKTPMSVLCVSTTETLELYLHGRYPLVSLPRSAAVTTTTTATPRVVVSNDLSYFLVQVENKMSLYNLPFIKEDRYPLQIIASLHASIMAHLTKLQTSMVEVVNSWKSTLKPLDTKLQPLLRLLKNYGVDDQPPGAILKQYILVGHTSESSSVANAMDQFFTSVQMNDQLLQRMIRSLHGALANVEAQARKSIQSPAQALCYDIQELAGQVQFHTHQHKSGDLPALVRASYQLWMSVERLMLALVEGRSKVRDLCGWLRSAGSQVKARGTAANSVQRENAKKRRVPQAVLERLLSTLNTSPTSTEGGSLSENLLQIEVSALLSQATDTKEKDRPPSPSSIVDLSSSDLTVVDATQDTLQAAESVLSNPLSNVPSGVKSIDFALPSFPSSEVSVAVHTRIGRDFFVPDPLQEDDEGEEEPTCFSPRVCKDGEEEPEVAYCRQWAIVAQAQQNSVQLFSIPLGIMDENDENGTSSESPPYCLTARLDLPASGKIRAVEFYSDDGKSSLSSGNDSGTGKEGRQKLGIVFEQGQQLELWLTKYDTLIWQSIPFEATLMAGSSVQPMSTVALLPMSTGEEVEGEESCIFAQTRTICSLESEPEKIGLYLCGSRGVGATSIVNQGVTTLELLDLEEDEDDDDYAEDYEEE